MQGSFANEQTFLHSFLLYKNNKFYLIGLDPFCFTKDVPWF